MKHFLLFATGIASLPLFSQHTLNEANHAPVNGDTYEMYSGTVAIPGPAGANVVWDFSNLVTSATTITYAASTTTNTSYPNASVTVHGSTGESAHYESSTSGMWFYGGNITAGNVSGTMTYTDPAVEAVYPMSLSTSSSAPISGSVQVTVPSVAASFTGNSHVIADGTGTLILPGGGTYSNTLRVVSSQTFHADAGLGMSADVIRVVYNYYTPGIKAPVISLAINSATALGSPSTNTLVLRNKNAPGVIVTNPNPTTTVQGYDQPAEIAVFPNPAASQLHVVVSGVNASSVALFDLTGKQVAVVTIKDNHAAIDVQSLHNGIYFYKVTDVAGRHTATGKVTVFH